MLEAILMGLVRFAGRRSDAGKSAEAAAMAVNNLAMDEWIPEEIEARVAYLMTSPRSSRSPVNTSNIRPSLQTGCGSATTERTRP